jgi:hypothetical protein
MSNETAGRGDPYWYEWFVGLLEVVEMLDPSSDVTSVAFQARGVKGWDDVVVTLRNDRRRCYQVKHTREQNNLTFGDLVAADSKGESLLGNLFSAWREANLNDGRTECVLYTNREAGLRGYTMEGGSYRPPLLQFKLWLQQAITGVQNFSEIAPCLEWRPAWDEWTAALNGNGVTDDERLAFLRALRIRADEDDLDGLETRIRERLALAFGVPTERVSPFVDALHRALKRWTTGYRSVTAEDVFSELALPAEQKELAPAPPPPEPFFPSREPLVGDLEKLLLAPQTAPVVFLSAEPGAGKTSVLSRITNRRIDVPLTGLIGLRYFCFEPIRPDCPIIAPDVGRVRPEMLWPSLLTQLREGLRGRLRELQVPLRNDLLDWREAQEHVLRLAIKLGEELARPFVIVIDGIDHAARAAQAGVNEARDFFASLPGPDALSGLPVRLFLAGQPAENYPQYPEWLKGHHPGVLRLSLNRLSTDDVRAEYLAKPTGLPKAQTEEAIRLIESVACGNTLATVFAVAEADEVTTLEGFAARLEERRLRDGLEAYYAAIWEYALATGSASAKELESSLVGALCLARGGLTPGLLSHAFSTWGVSAASWRRLLESLGPLLVEAQDGFRVRHNDVRLFLAARFACRSAAERQHVASALVDYYLSPAPLEMAVHAALFPLLPLAGRAPEATRVFTVNWVCEAAALGIGTAELIEEYRAALHALPTWHRWDSALTLACAGQTLERLVEQREERRNIDAHFTTIDIPPFLPCEASVKPRNRWTVSTFTSLIDDAERLLAAAMDARARGLLDRWLGGMSVVDVVRTVKDSVVKENWGAQAETLQNGVDALFVRLGRLLPPLGWEFALGNAKTRPEHYAAVSFERGYVEKCCSDMQAQTLGECFAERFPYYLASLQLAVERFAHLERWALVKEVLGELSNSVEELPANFVAEATWWSLISGAAANDSAWLDVLEKPGYGLTSDSSTPITIYLAVARARGWLEIANEPAEIAEQIQANHDAQGVHEGSASSARLLFRAAALIGRVRGVVARSGWAAAAEIISSAEARNFLSALWDPDVIYSARFPHASVAAHVAAELADICLLLPQQFAAVAAEAALPYARTFPVDFRRSALWRVLTYAGKREVLQAWLVHWLGPNGRAWSSAPSERMEIVYELTPLARDLALQELADAAMARLDSSIIGYRFEERGFGEATRWLEELLRREPKLWTDEGAKLWSLVNASEEQSCSVDASSEIEESLAGAAMRCGPTDLWRFVAATLPNVTDRKWHYESRNRLGGGLAMALRHSASFSIEERLTLWCLVVAFCRWFDGGDIVTLAELRAKLLEHCADEEERKRLTSELKRLTPGESQRTPAKDRSERRQTRSLPPEPEDYSAAELIAQLNNGTKLRISDVAEAIRYFVRVNEPSREDLIPKLLAAVGASEEYGINWVWNDNFAEAGLLEITSLVTDEQLWSLALAISTTAGARRSWLNATAENLHRLCFARASACGLDELRAGFPVHLAMHRAWAFGASKWQRSWMSLPPVSAVGTWEELMVRTLEVLFTSRSAEVVSSAVTGMHALVDLHPGIIASLFEQLKANWAQRWLLNAAEAWAALHPAALETVRPVLEQTMRSAPLDARLQSWIVLCKLSDTQSRERPDFPMFGGGQMHGRIQAPDAGILETAPIQLGLMRQIDRHASAKGKIDRLRACGLDFSSVERSIAKKLLDLPTEGTSRAALKSAPYRDDDFMCSGLETDHAVGECLEAVLNPAWCTTPCLPRLTQGLFDNEDAWLLRQTPLPSPNPDEWPNEELGAFARSVNAETVLERFRFLAAHQDLPQDWIMVAAYVCGATWQEDFALFQWMEQLPIEPGLLLPLRWPTVPSGRTFNWWLGDRFEPHPPNDVPVMTFFTGGSQRLIHASVEIQPAKLWQDFDWSPDRADPLTWVWNAKPVARYQRFHGPPNTSGRGPHHRQPILHRWVVHTEALERALRRLDHRFRMREDFVRLKDDFEK